MDRSARTPRATFVGHIDETEGQRAGIAGRLLGANRRTEFTSVDQVVQTYDQLRSDVRISFGDADVGLSGEFSRAKALHLARSLYKV